MKLLTHTLRSAVLTAALSLPLLAHADAITQSTIGAGGYDLTTYFSSEKPARGNGHHVAIVDGVSYLFSSEDNKRAFEANPQKYLPAYGGYCAYGASVGKKFIADPDVYDVVDGKLYFNLDSKIRGLWSADVKGHIGKADANWKTIGSKPAASL